MSSFAEQRGAYEAAKAEAKRRQADRLGERRRYRDLPGKADRIKSQVIEDVRRVAKDPLNRSTQAAVSRKSYRELGWWPEVVVVDLFGNHSELLRSAGLAPLRGSARVETKGARLHTEQEIAEFAREHVLPYAGEFDRGLADRRHIEGVAVSDLHSAHCDPFGVDVFHHVSRTVSADYIGFVGDVVDFPDFSTHPKFPGHFGLSSWGEVQWARELFRRTREQNPNAQIDFVIGNHEHRLVRFLANTAPQFHEWPTLRFDEVFGLREFEINLVCRSSFLTPTVRAKKQDVLENWTQIGDLFTISHGTSCAKHSAATELELFKTSGLSGHVHRPGIAYSNSPGTGPICWTSLPMLAYIGEHGKDYVPGVRAWNGGFGRFAIDVPSRYVEQQIVKVEEECALFAGHRFAPTDEHRKIRAAMAA